ncbi:unnamed protein product [marine sediment metagenome]|uniref:Uncharacterized protein n=1 Tax=marine sediment metagenome TaxID=412755 RepID=X1H685_9ZZZZ
MDLAAIAETTVEMWVLVNTKLIARQQDNLDPEIQATILSESMKLYMTHIINEKRTESTTPGSTSSGPKATEKQIAFIKDLGGTPTEGMTSFQASKLIEELKGR